jgi:hypothetical protein
MLAVGSATAAQQLLHPHLKMCWVQHAGRLRGSCGCKTLSGYSCCARQQK